MSDSKWLAAVSLVLLIVGFPLVVLTQWTYTDPVYEKASFLQKLASSPPNEIGDVLAGIFGSLAFFAAAIAVFMQSRELRLTRAEMQEQRIVSETTAKALQDQLNFFREESEQRRYVANKDQFEALLRSAIWQIQSAQKESLFIQWLTGSVPERFVDGTNVRVVRYANAETIDAWLIRLFEAIEARIQARKAVDDGHVDFVDVMFEGDPSLSVLEEAILLLERAVALQSDMDPSQTIRVNGMKLHLLLQNLKVICSDPGNFTYRESGDK